MCVVNNIWARIQRFYLEALRAVLVDRKDGCFGNVGARLEGD